MSLRNMEVQYVGDTLYLPPLEREVKHIIVREVKDLEHFKPKRICHFIKYPDNYPYETDDGYCSECHELMYEHYAYCPSCGAKVVSE